jgi:hypothetical protein
VAILGGMKSTDAFGQDVGVTRVKGYLVFILAFTAISNSVVSPIIHFCDECINNHTTALCWVNIVSSC